MPPSLCLACSSNVATSVMQTSPSHITSCCDRIICSSCLLKYPRLATYQPCLACLGGAEVVRSAREANRVGLKVGGVSVDDVYVIGDSDEENDDTDLKATAGPPPAYGGVQNTTELNLTTRDEQSMPKSDMASTTAAENERSRIGRNTEYWIKPSDSLVGIALKLGVDERLLCKMNALPLSTLSVTPHLLHTRTTLVIPPTPGRIPSPPPADLQERLERRAQETATKRMQFVTKEVNPYIARAYVSLAGDDSDHGTFEDKPTKRPAALEERAVDQYLEDEEWEKSQKRMGLQPKLPKFPFFPLSSAWGATSSAGETPSPWKQLPSFWK